METEKIFKRHLINSINKQREYAAKELQQVELQLKLKPDEKLTKLKIKLLDNIQTQEELIKDLEKLK